jgi:trk system potassium uptake protein TrkH
VVAAATSPLVLAVLVARSPLFHEILEYFYDHPTLLILVAFASLIVLGVLLLTLPAASPGPESISPIDALFTSTSATCVTGLIVLDTPNDFTVFGQAVILTLIQIGGLGIMVLSTFALVALGRRLGVKGEQALDDLMETRGVRSAYRLTKFVVGTTFAIESIGAVVLTVGYHAHGQPWRAAIWDGIFHAISAFCNAGFALRSDSIVLFRHDPWMIATFSTLIIIGGIGFVVLAALWSQWTNMRRPEFKTHASVVVVATAILLGSGALVYGALEWNASLGPLPPGERVANAMFQSVTLRTAGFNSVPFESLRSSTAVFMMVFMFVGAAPGSTGGGVKVTTVAVLLGVVRAIGSGRSAVVFFGRRIADEIVYRAIGIVTIFTAGLAAGATVLFVLEDIAFRSLLFETFSALGTVGLSLGATGELGAAGKLVVVILMFLGRTGPLSLAVVLGERDTPNVEYPPNRILVG